MFAGRTSLTSIAQLAHQAATGEFIAVADDFEVHVFFQLGRVAWGTSSGHRLAFSSHLFQHCNVDKEVFRELVETCRTESKPLGETLVAWGLVTQDDVRDALEKQLTDTLQCLSELDNPQTLFLPRDSFAVYDTELTFAVDDILEKGGLAAQLPQTHDQTNVRSEEKVLAMFAEFKAHVPDSLWMELLAADTLASAPETHECAIAPSLAEIFLDGSADFVAIRTLAGTVLGGRLHSEGESLWTGLGRNAMIGNAFSALGPVLSARLTASGDSYRYSEAPWSLVGDGGEVLQRVRAAIEHTDEVLAAFSLNDDGEQIWSCARESLPLAELTRSAQQWSTALDLDIVDAAFETTSVETPSSSRYSSRSLVVANPDMWTYGHGYDRKGRGGLWLCVDRSTSQGLGWAILTSLARFVCPVKLAQ